MKVPDASPAQKKLKQARLSFGTPQSSAAKKPRLETEEHEASVDAAPSASKTEPSPLPAPEVVEIDDDSSQDTPELVEEPSKPEKKVNPLLPMVDVALKRKLKQKNGVKSKRVKKVEPKAKNNRKKNVDTEEKKSEKFNPSQFCEISLDADSEEESNNKNNGVITPIKNDDSSKLIQDPPESTAEPSVQESLQDEKVSSESPKSNKKNDESPKLDEVSKPSPKSKECSETNNATQTNKTPKSTKKTNLNKSVTPKQIGSAKKENQIKLDKAEKERLRRERELEREEKAKIKQQKEEEKRIEREERERLKEEKERIKEEKKREREAREKDIKLKKEREEQEKKLKKEQKEIVKRENEERIEEEKRKKILEKEKSEVKKKRAAEAFQSFFIAKEKCSKANESFNQSLDDSTHNYLSNFCVKSDMRLAPLFRKCLADDNKTSLDAHLKTQNGELVTMYVKKLKSGSEKPLSSEKTWPLEDLKNELVIIEDDLPPEEDTKEENQVISNKLVKSAKPKLFSFTENRRPPYWGTWTKKSPQVTGRRPFAIDKTYLDYTCDSDEEWEEEEPGESVESVAGSDDEDGDNEYDVDNDFMVPHGYLSDEEVLGEDESAVSPETQKAKLKFLEEEFEDEMKKPTKIKKPRLIGIVWQNSEGERPSTCPLAVWEFLNNKKILSSVPEIEIEYSTNMDSDIGEEKSVKKNKEIPEEKIPDLIRLVHGNTNSRSFLVKEFQTYITKSNKGDETETNSNEISIDISKVSIARKIKSISKWMPCPEEGIMQSKLCWYVDKSIREKYGLEDLQVPNSWTYCLIPKRKSEIPKTENPKPIASTDTGTPFNITKFTKKMTREEKEKQFAKSPSQASPCNGENLSKPISLFTTAAQPEKKRVSLLFSGPIGKELPNSGKKDDDSEENTDETQKIIQNGKTMQEKENNSPQPHENVSLEKQKKKPIKTNLLTQFLKTATVKYAHTEKEENDEDCVLLSD